MSNEPKYQVFISSTYTDLVEARRAAINTVLESYNFPVGMELFGADNDEQWSIIKELIDISDYYILILGHRYGSISKADGISFTEKEFDYAVSKGVKLMCFVRNEHVATHPHERDTDNENLQKLQLFRTKVLTNRLCEFWDSVDDLKHKISSSLYKNMRKHGGVGWVRGNQVSGHLAEELARLSEENRKLREENILLKSQTEERVPKLEITVNDTFKQNQNLDEELKIAIPKLNGSAKFVRPKKRELKYVRAETALEKTFWNLANDFGLKQLNEYIEIYNKEIDDITEEDIENHNKSLKLLNKLENGILQLDLNIENSGNSIANLISVDIEVPDFLMIIDDKSKDNLKTIRELFEKNILNILTPEERREKTLKSRTFDVPIIKPYIPNFKQNNSNTEDYTENNFIHISINTLMHTKRLIFDNYYLFPLMVGNGILKIKVICSELKEQIYFEIPISVTE